MVVVVVVESVMVSGVAVVSGDVVVVVVVLLLELCVGDGFTIVVFVSVLVLGEASGVTVSVFCSQAARRAALARIEMYFFMILWVPLKDKVESEAQVLSVLRAKSRLGLGEPLRASHIAS